VYLCVLLLPGGNWIAAAQDMRGRMYIIDQAGDLYYDSGNPEIGIYAVSFLGVGHVEGIVSWHCRGLREDGVFAACGREEVQTGSSW
jgi:hypothetical protein